MLMRFIVIAGLLLGTSACAKNSSVLSTGPSTVPIPVAVSTPVMAPSPANVDPAVWAIGFVGNRLYRPDAVHIMFAGGTDEANKATWAMVVGAVNGFIGGKTPIDLSISSTGATYSVELVPGFVCGADGLVHGGCTLMQLSSEGKITGGRIVFTTVSAMNNQYLIMHEVFRTLGVYGNSPKTGIMSQTPWPELRPTDEEELMFLGRYDYPLLSSYAP